MSVAAEREDGHSRRTRAEVQKMLGKQHKNADGDCTHILIQIEC